MVPTAFEEIEAPLVRPGQQGAGKDRAEGPGS
jgi:hypothetical protein